MSSSRLDGEQRITLSNDGCFHHSTLGHAPTDQNSTRSTLQSFLEFLDQHCHNDGVNSTYKEIIRICIVGMLANYQSEASGYSDEPQTIAPNGLDELNAVHRSSATISLPQSLAFQHLQRQLLGQDYRRLSQASVTNMPEAEPLFRQLPPGVLYLFLACFPSNAYHMQRLDQLLFHTSGPFSYEPDTKSSQPFVPENEAQTFSDSFDSRHQQLRLPVMQGGQEKVRCTWLGCSRVIKKDNHARHVEEIHLRKVKAVCNDCGREFSRMYMKKNHVCRGSSPKRKSS